MTGPWLVRLGSKRGAGEYVHPEAYVDITGAGRCLATVPHQRKARRFTWRDLADVYARAFGGRVVRLRERGPTVEFACLVHEGAHEQCAGSGCMCCCDITETRKP